MNEEEKQPLDGASILEALDVIKLLLHRPTGYSVIGRVASQAHTIAPEDKNDYVEVEIPFCGTYDSVISQCADHDVEWRLEPDNWENYDKQELAMSSVFRDFIAELDSNDVELIQQKRTRLEVQYVLDMNYYLKCYIGMVQNALETQLGHPFERNLVLNEMVSPREYNFTTDTLWVYMHKVDWEALQPKKILQTEEYKEYAKPLYTSRDGYIPYYSKEDYFDVTNTIRCSQGVLAYHLAKYLQSMNVDNYDEDTKPNLHDVRWDLGVYFMQEYDGMIRQLDMENCELYLYKNEDPEQFDKR